MLQAYLTLNVLAFFVVFARVGTAFVVMPGFSAAYVPEQVRLLIALLLTFTVFPMVSPLMPALPTSPAELVLMLGVESLIGIFLGLIGRVLLGTLQTTGTLVALFSSLANAFVRDPIAEQQSSVFGGFLVTLGLIIVFVTDTHHLMIRAVIDSYDIFAPGAAIEIGDFADFLAHQVAASFSVGVRMAAPFIVAGIAYYLGLGLLGRLMPQLPVFFFGLPVQVATQLTILMLSLSGMMLVFMNHFENVFRTFAL